MTAENPTLTSYFLCVVHDEQQLLLLVELLFCFPVSNAKVERLFSLMNRVKTDCRSSLKEQCLNSLIRIGMEGPSCEEFDPTVSIETWAYSSQTTRRPHQSLGKNVMTA